MTITNLTEETSWHRYPKVWAMGHAQIKDLLLDPVLCEEKIDGSQISWGRFDGELKVRSRGKQIVIDAPEKMFQKAIDIIKDLPLHDGWTYRGEYLQKPKHNCLAYARTPEKHIIIFDINTGLEEYVSYKKKKKEAERIRLEVVPLLYQGIISDAEQFMSFLDTVSILGGTTIEGVVVKNYKRFGLDKKSLMGKYVSEKFKEKHEKEWKKSNPSRKDILFVIIEKYRKEARWEKAIQHLKERGEHEASTKDIGNMIKEVQADIEEECKEEISEILYRIFMPKIKRGVVRGLPEWYKEKLLKSQFEAK